MPETLTLQPNLFESLAPAERRGPCISIYLPQQSSQLSAAQRKFRFIKLVKKAERLVAQDHGVSAARQLVADLWQSEPMELIEQSGLSLAFFHDQEFTGALHLPLEVPERMVVADSFHVKPVLSWLQSSPHFYLISLTSRRLKLYEGTPWQLKLRETIGMSEAESEPNRGGRPRREDSKEQVRQFFLKAEREIHPILSRNRSPVVIAGVSWLHPIYRSVNRDPDLLSHAIHGNVEKWSEENLRQAVFATLGKLFEQAKQRAVEEYQELSYQGRASDDLSRIAQAAVKGRVRKLLIASDQLLFGKIHPQSGGVTLHPEQLDSTDDDMLDDLAETVLAQGGKVLCIPSQDLPTANPLAAVFSR